MTTQLVRERVVGESRRRQRESLEGGAEGAALQRSEPSSPADSAPATLPPHSRAAAQPSPCASTAIALARVRALL